MNANNLLHLPPVIDGRHEPPLAGRHARAEAGPVDHGAGVVDGLAGGLSGRVGVREQGIPVLHPDAEKRQQIAARVVYGGDTGAARPVTAIKAG